MDKELVEAALTGNIELLRDLLGRDPLILKRAAVLPAGGDTALHIACLAGHIHFVHELLNHAPEYASRVNHNGLSPVHIAAATGSVEILHELLKVDSKSCLVRGRERKIPLHYAATNGHVPALKQLLDANRESIQSVTSQGETVFHLAVQSYKFNVLSVLVDHVTGSFVDRGTTILNKKDGQGNAILHLAAYQRQHEVIDLLQRVMGTVEVNAQNEKGHTALDLLPLHPGKAWGDDIEDKIKQAGGSSAADLSQSAISNHTITSSEPHNNQRQMQSLPSNFWKLIKYNNEIDTPREARDVLLLIATLIATATFQAGLSTEQTKQDPSYQQYEKAMDVCLWILFVIFNTLGLLTSLHMINILTPGLPLKLELQVSMTTLIITYMTFITNRMPLIAISSFIMVPIVITILFMFQPYILKKMSSSSVENTTRV